MKNIIHVNNHHIKHNLKNKLKRGELKPVLTCKNYKRNVYGHEVEIYDKSGRLVIKLVYRPDKPLKCGATAWIELDDKDFDVKVVDINQSN